MDCDKFSTGAPDPAGRGQRIYAGGGGTLAVPWPTACLACVGVGVSVDQREGLLASGAAFRVARSVGCGRSLQSHCREDVDNAGADWVLLNLIRGLHMLGDADLFGVKKV